MRILHITPHYIPAWHLGGIVKSTSDLCRELVRLGHGVTVFTTDSGRSKRMAVPVNQAVNIDGVEVFYFKTDFSLRFAYSRSLGKACKRMIRNFDIVHLSAIWHYPDIPGGYYAIREKVPFVVRPSSAMMLHGLKKSPLKKWLYLSSVELRNFKNAQGIHYTSLMERELSHPRIHTLPSFIVPNGINTDDFRNLPERASARRHFGLPDNAFTGVFLGRLAPIKNLASLINAVALARNQGCDVFLLIAGIDYGERKNLEALTTQLGLDDRVRFLGHVDPEVRNILLAAGDFLALPTYQENFGNAVVEGMAAGLPVLVSDQVGICREVEIDQAGIVTGVEADSIAQGLVTLASQPTQLKEMGRKGRQAAADRYSIQSTAKKMERAYLDILDGVQTPDLLWSNKITYERH